MPLSAKVLAGPKAYFKITLRQKGGQVYGSELNLSIKSGNSVDAQNRW